MINLAEIVHLLSSPKHHSTTFGLISPYHQISNTESPHAHQMLYETISYHQQKSDFQ